MAAIEVTCLVQQYPDDGSGMNATRVEVKAHRIHNDRVLINIDGRVFIVIGRHMITAIENAMRTSR